MQPSQRVVIIVNGAFRVQMGLNSEMAPSTTIRCVVGRERFIQSKRMVLGEKVLDRVNELQVSCPITNGEIHDFDAMRAIWKKLEQESGLLLKDENVLIVDTPLVKNRARLEMIEIFFEELNVQQLSLVPAPLMALYTSGKMTGVSVDLGKSQSRIYPVIDGYTIKRSIADYKITGDRIDQYLEKQLGDKLKIPYQYMKEDVLLRIKKDFGCTEEGFNMNKYKPEKFILPDGNCILIEKERFSSSLYFNPELDNIKDVRPLHEEIKKVIFTSDPPSQASLASNVQILGSSSFPLLPYFRDSVSPFGDPSSLAYIGGALFSALSSWGQSNSVISRECYSSTGARSLLF